MSGLWMALLGTGFTFMGTALGAAMVFFFRKEIPRGWNRAFLGFAAGVMIAASVFSLLIPAMDMAGGEGMRKVIPAAGGFALGAAFLLALDKLLPHMHAGSDAKEGLPSSLQKTTMLVLAVTLHNVPEGLAVGLAFGLAGGGHDGMSVSGAVALALGMALQNFPEGAAISLPLKREGLSNRKSFVYGALSGVVEPIAGVLGVLMATAVQPLMPWFLAFAAGAMIYVVVEELIPEANLGEHSHVGTLSVMAGFLLMMLLDVGLG